jgi:hypothetical protein
MTSRRGRVRGKIAICLAPALLALPCACASDDAGSDPKPSAQSSTPTAAEGSRTKPEPGSVCADVARRVSVAYTIHAEPTTAGQGLWATLRVRNGLSRQLWIGIGGAVGVTEASEGFAPLLIWGGSSADTVIVRGGTDRTYPVYAYLQNPSGSFDGPLPVPTGARVIGVAAHAGFGSCELVARVSAPRGLVVGHPEPSWVLPTGRAATRQQNAIVRRAMAR